MAIGIIREQPHLAGNPYVFAGRSKDGPISGFSSRHEAFKARCGVDGFHVHDLRRCARSLMARAGVQPHIAERVLGHAVGGVEGVYDVHRYDAEKADALKRLARLIETNCRWRTAARTSCRCALRRCSREGQEGEPASHRAG